MQTKTKLGRLNNVELRKAWAHEALDFTNWLAEPENISLLSDEVGINIKPIQTEAAVGNFKLDILAEEENTGRKIIIENQLESTNHDHLGKIITYASGLGAEIVIWIVKTIREEHEQAVDWLNEHTDEKINFFIIKMELWQIGDSPLAPKFQVISKPNDWAKIVKSSVVGDLTETKLLQKSFWDDFKNYAKNANSKLKLRNTSPQHWYDISLGFSDAHISLTINTREDLIGCEIYIANSKTLFKHLEKNKNEIEAELQEVLIWDELPEKKASRIRLTKEARINDKEQWANYFDWLKTTAEKFNTIFSKYIKKVAKEVKAENEIYDQKLQASV